MMKSRQRPAGAGCYAKDHNMAPMGQGTLLWQRLFSLQVTHFLFPVCVDAAGYKCVYSKGVDMIQGQHAHTKQHIQRGSTFTLGNEQLAVRWSHTGCTFALQYYHLLGCVGTCQRWAVQDTHQGFPRLALLAAPNGEWTTSELPLVELPRLARPMGCFSPYCARSIDELSGRTTGRLGYVRPNSAYAIGGTAELALQYSN